MESAGAVLQAGSGQRTEWFAEIERYITTHKLKCPKCGDRSFTGTWRGVTFTCRCSTALRPTDFFPLFICLFLFLFLFFSLVFFCFVVQRRKSLICFSTRPMALALAPPKRICGLKRRKAIGPLCF